MDTWTKQPEIMGKRGSMAFSDAVKLAFLSSVEVVAALSSSIFTATLTGTAFVSEAVASDTGINLARAESLLGPAASDESS